MPVITDEQIELAKSIDTLSYLRMNEPNNLKREDAARYTLRDTDSLVLSNGKWFWFSQGFGGYNALDFLVKVRGIAFPDAVAHLTDGRTYQAQLPLSSPKHEKPKKPFALPPATANNDKVYAYLRRRGIDGEIIMSCFKAGTLYQSKSGNCIFVGYDGDEARFACERGTEGDYKRDVSGSDKRFSFFLPPRNPGSRH